MSNDEPKPAWLGRNKQRDCLQDLVNFNRLRAELKELRGGTFELPDGPFWAAYYNVFPALFPTFPKPEPVRRRTNCEGTPGDPPLSRDNGVITTHPHLVGVYSPRSKSSFHKVFFNARFLESSQNEEYFLRDLPKF